LTLNKQETAIRQGKAREAVLPVIVPVKKNQTIIREGAVIQPVHILLLDEIKRLRSEQRRDFIALVMAAMFVAMMLIFLSYLRRFTTTRVKVSSKDMVAMGTVTLMVVLICKVLLFVTTSAFEERFRDLIPSSAYLYLMPMAAGPMLIGLLVSSGEVVWLFTLFLSAVLSLMVDQSFAIFVVSIVGGIAAARGVYNCKKRNDIYFAGLRAGLVNMVIIACLSVITSEQQDQLIPLLLWNVPAGLIAGIMSSLIAMMLVPFLESVFNYSTDVKLLELSNLNHPLLKEMIVKAPGTYHHSLVVGSMVEAAAEEIGANPLLAKVSAYYHDIGKTEHAGYFIENQRSGYNPHDHISPHMSKTVLIAHVKDGVELGGKFNLGTPIIDVIIQHHGTTLISYFYHKAKQSEDASMHSVHEEEFRYPGPKPQFKEAALCMLADSIEAAARCLDEPQPVRLQNIVKNIIHSKFMDGQLDECNLTLRDLSIIEASFNRILLGIYHQRIDYPTGKKPSEPGTPSGSKKPIASA
ncbi:MAG: HDIG domain-containing metalloprotein, partial [Bdellovibrionia bacterium]